MRPDDPEGRRAFLREDAGARIEPLDTLPELEPGDHADVVPDDPPRVWATERMLRIWY